MTQQSAGLQTSSTSSGAPASYTNEIARMMQGVGVVYEVVDRITSAWRQDHLVNAVPSTGPDFDAYAKPITVLAEILRGQGMRDLTHRILRVAIQLTDAHCLASGLDLHRGAMYANFGIANLEFHDYEIGLSWLLAAANEDVRFHRVPDIHSSYAWAHNGIYGQWVNSEIFGKMPANAFALAESRLNITIGLPELMELLKNIAGNGDLNLIRGIVDYESVRGRTDYMGHSVRFACFRDLASLFEVMLKLFGERHNDPQVRAAFLSSPMLANIIHFMHYPKTRKRGIQRWLHNLKSRFFAPSAYSSGLLWNSVQKQEQVLLAIKKEFNYVKNFNSHSIADVWQYLQTHHPLNPAQSADEEVAKHMLLSYRMRNQTSHSFEPEDVGIVANADNIHLWLLQSIFYVYFWFTRTGQVTL